MPINNDILNQINREVKLIQPEAEIVLYGSRARGDFKLNSDWDILVLVENHTKDNLIRLIKDKIFEIELEFEIAISTIIYEKSYWNDLSFTPFYENVSNDGIIIE